MFIYGGCPWVIIDLPKRWTVNCHKLSQHVIKDLKQVSNGTIVYAILNWSRKCSSMAALQRDFSKPVSVWSRCLFVWSTLECVESHRECWSTLSRITSHRWGSWRTTDPQPVSPTPTGQRAAGRIHPPPPRLQKIRKWAMFTVLVTVTAQDTCRNPEPAKCRPEWHGLQRLSSARSSNYPLTRSLFTRDHFCVRIKWLRLE